MAWYVFALVDAPPRGAKGKGLSGALGLRPIPGGFAVVERRADVPPAEFAPLQRHQDVVAQLAERVPAILPVRFGTLLDDAAIDEVLEDRGAEIADALAAVRGKVQFTWRRRTAPHAKSSPPRAARSLREGEPSGAEYLRRAARAARAAPPPAWRPLRRKLAPLVAAERYQPATATTPESLYHLVRRDAVKRYAALGAALSDADARLTVTGPWPPFAFAAALL
ncbi:MAG TPA: GvpL/GvpF family gas vesicle protein [Vicinamibacterales bacterium]|nr:GvpL/GvpF family gas vesicle protein [Vicinamibacterales bacterium]